MDEEQQQHHGQNGVNLTDLKKQIASEIRPLIPQVSNAEDRFYAITALLREQWEDELAADAFVAAKHIADVERRVQSLQTIMSEISFHERELADKA